MRILHLNTETEPIVTDRTVRVTLTAQVSGYLNGMQQAQKSTNATSDAAQKLANKRQAFRDVGVAAMAMGAVAAAGVALAIKAFSDFDAEMAQVKALSHATSGEMQQLTDAALNIGQKFGYSATQVAQAETELVKAGISVKDIMGGALTGALTLAADGQMDVADATQIAAEAMTQFGLKGKDVPHIADLLAAGADKALGSVGDLGTALESGGLVAAQFGLSIDDTVGTLSAFAQAGLLGERAGTTLRQMFLKLGNPSAEAAKSMKDLGITIYDASGKFVGITNLAGQLKDKLKDLAPAQRNAALATIFGSRAILGANILYKDGAKGIQGWIEKVNDQGFAAEQAQAKLNSLNGDIKKLAAAFNTDLIKAGSSANGMLRGLVQNTTGLVNALGGLPQPVMTVGLGLTALVAGVGLLGGGFLLLVPRIQATRLAMSELGLTGRSVAKYFGKGGLILLGLTAIASALAGANEEAQLTSDQLAKVNASFKSGDVKNFTAQLDSMSGSFTNLKGKMNYLYTGNFFSSARGAQGIASALDTLTLGATHLSDVFKTSEAQFTAYGQALASLAGQDLPKATTKFAAFIKAAGGGKEAIRQALQAMPDYKAQLIQLASAQGITLSQQQLFNLAIGKGSIAQRLSIGTTASNKKALSDLSGQADDTTGSVSDLTDAINDFGKGALDTDSATRAFKQAVDDMTTSVANNGATLDLNTQAGRDNDAALSNVAQTTLGLVSAQATAGASSATLTASMQTGRNSFIAAAQAAGMTAAQAVALANKYGLIPANVTTAVGITGAASVLDAGQQIINRLNGIQRNIDISVRLHGAGNLATTGGLLVPFAGGGTVPNVGTPKSDSVLARLSAGEEVTQEPYASIYRRELKQMNAGTFPRFAGGGTVPQTYVSGPRQYPSSSSTGTQSTPNFNVVLQPKGGVDLLQYIDVKIAAADRSNEMVTIGGRRA